MASISTTSLSPFEIKKSSSTETSESSSPSSSVPNSNPTDFGSALSPPIEIPFRVTDELHSRGFHVDNCGIVRWRRNSVSHPRHWPLFRKAYDSAIICFLEMFTTMISNTGSSVANDAAKDFQIGRVSAVACFVTIYLVGQAIGGLILPPVCESFGGKSIYFYSTFAYACLNVLIGALPRLPVVIICRFLAGALSAMPSVVGAGSLENMWDIRARIFLIHLWIASAVVGLALGPPMATFIGTSSLGWHWIFYVAAIIGFALSLLCLGMQESRPTQVLLQHVKIVSRKTSFDHLALDNNDSMPDLRTFLCERIFMPTRLFFTEPIVCLTSIMAATVYGIAYLFSEAFSVVYQNYYHFSTRASSLVNLAIGVGVVFTFLPRIYDVHITSRRQRQNIPIEPEDKLFGFYLAAPILAIGLWWFGATIPPLVPDLSPWISIASLVLFGYAVVEFDNVLSGYLTDTYASYAASACASLGFLRAILSGVFPLFGQQMFTQLGPNYAQYILASLATAYCGAAVLFSLYGKSIRAQSSFASTTWKASQSNASGYPSDMQLQTESKAVV